MRPSPPPRGPHAVEDTRGRGGGTPREGTAAYAYGTRDILGHITVRAREGRRATARARGGEGPEGHTVRAETHVG